MHSLVVFSWFASLCINYILEFHEFSEPVVNSGSLLFTWWDKAFQPDVFLLREPTGQMFNFHWQVHCWLQHKMAADNWCERKNLTLNWMIMKTKNQCALLSKYTRGTKHRSPELRCADSQYRMHENKHSLI